MNKRYRLAQQVINRLKDQNKTLSTAESCTGGMIGEAITSRPGSSTVFKYGWITYSNEAKSRLLGVDESIFKITGAVSAECVEQMALGALKKSDSDFAVAVSGIAGPGGGTEEKPTGLVYVAFCQKGETPESKKLMLKGGRNSVRKQTTEFCFTKLLFILAKSN